MTPRLRRDRRYFVEFEGIEYWAGRYEPKMADVNDAAEAARADGFAVDAMDVFRGSQWLRRVIPTRTGGKEG